jgi:hypothetical protein
LVQTTHRQGAILLGIFAINVISSPSLAEIQSLQVLWPAQAAMPSENKWCVVVMLCGAAEKENEEEEEKSSWSEQFAMALTSAYAVQQSAAAAKCGVPSGEVWRTALETASNVGTKQVTAVSILYRC